MKVSVVTATYNRCNTLERLYNSLINQSNSNFEWIIIDDGSTDGTYKWLNELKNNVNKFAVQILTQENSGKHVAINRALDIANGELFFIVDSDDILPTDAIDVIVRRFDQFNKNKDNVIGISALKADMYNRPIGNSFKKLDFLDIVNTERKKYGISGDRAEVFFTCELKKYKFPVFENEKFISEAVIWNKMAYEGKKLRFVNDIIYNCEYQENGLSNNIEKAFLRNWSGYSYYVNQEILYRKTLFRKVSIVCAYRRLAEKKELSNKEIRNNLSNASEKIILLSKLLYGPYKLFVK